VRRAEEVFEREAAKSFSIDLSDVSKDQWFLVPPPGDFVTEVRTRRFGTLTYARNQNQPEDVTLFNRERRRTVALYPSAQKLATQGPIYDEDELSDLDVTAYDIEASLDPTREFINARARVTPLWRAFVTVRTASRSCRRSTSFGVTSRTGNNWATMIRITDGYSRGLVAKRRRQGT